MLGRNHENFVMQYLHGKNGFAEVSKILVKY